MGYQKITVPADGDKITVNADLSLNVPNHPIIPYIEGDGIGVDISPVMMKVVNAAIEKAYGTKRGITWMDAFIGTIQGCLGETSTIACLIGLAFLLVTKIANWRLVAGCPIDLQPANGFIYEKSRQKFRVQG